MFCFSPIFQKKTMFFAGSLLLIVCAAPFCKNEPMEDTTGPLENLVDSIFGVHTGDCYYYRKQLDTGVETFDTTAGSALEIVRIDSIWIHATGCGTSFTNWYLPIESSDTVFAYSAYVGSHHYTMEISLADRTIVAQETYSAMPFAPFIERYNGVWKF